MNLDLFKDCTDPVEKCLKDAKMTKNDIHDIVLVGGSTRIPKVEELLQELFNGKKLCKSINPDEAVAYGAAFHAASLTGAAFGLNKDVVLVDVAPLSLGIETNGGDMSIVVPRNTPIPIKMTKKNYQNAFDYVTRCCFIVYEGERPFAKDNHFLGEIFLNGITPAPKGVAKYDVHFEIDANGILTVSAELVGSKNKNQITITNHNGRSSKEEIDRMVKEAEVYKAQDEERKKASKAKNILENYIHHVRDALRSCRKGVNVKNMISLKDAVEKTEQWLEWNYLLGEASKFEEKMKALKTLCESVIRKKHLQGSNTCVKSEIIYTSDNLHM